MGTCKVGRLQSSFRQQQHRNAVGESIIHSRPVEPIDEQDKSTQHIVDCQPQMSADGRAQSRREYSSNGMSENRISFMPHYQIPKARLLCAEMHMSLSQFSIFTSLIRSAAKRYLNCGLRPEDQDPNDLQQFMRMANKTGMPFKWNCQATVRAYCGPKKPTESPRLCERSASNAENETIKMVYPLRNCVSVVIKRLCKEISTPDSASGADSETDINPLSSKASSPSPPRAIAPLCTDPVLNFLSSAKPNLTDFHSHFVNMGFIDDNALKAFFSWPVDVQESMMRAKLGRSMNSLQLHGLLVAMRARRESTL
ncbi:hypothetical protein EDD17DRAFT_1506952 [Pisolithus thermaeus]|nr:hypothetical protein EDD17DRAFT_1506952 [Pisolithus thermaeus]